MRNKINLGSFVLSIICILLFLVISFSGPIDHSVLGTHPLNLVLYISLLTLSLGVIGFAGIHDWKGMVRSVATIIITLGLSVFLTFVLFLGSLLS